MSAISVTDGSFDKNITNSYFLSIQVSLNGLSFCVLDPIRNLYILFKHIPFAKPDKNYSHTQELLITEEVLNYSYKRVFFLFNTPYATLVPANLYHYDHSKKSLQLTSNICEDNYKVIEQKIKLADTWNVFAIPRFLYHLVKTQFKDVSFFQQYTPIVEANLITSKTETQPEVYLHIHPDEFDLAIIQKHRLLLCNSFSYKNNTEFVYFILYSVEQLNLDKDKLKIMVIGLSNYKDERLLLLERYIKNVKLEAPTPHFEFSSSFKASLKGNYQNLFNLPLCV